MTWSYAQSTGIITDPTGRVVGEGYSGHGVGLNNPETQREQNIGPIPRGHYTIGSAFLHSLAGPVTMRLISIPGTETFGRDGFMIHGDSRDHTLNPTPDNSASHGCIVTRRDVRLAISVGRDRTLTVTA